MGIAGVPTFGCCSRGGAARAVCRPQWPAIALGRPSQGACSSSCAASGFGRQPPTGLASATRQSGEPTTSGVDAVGATAGVGESSTFAGAIMLGLVGADALVADMDLDVAADHHHLDLAVPVCRPDPLARPGEGQIAGGVDLSNHGRVGGWGGCDHRLPTALTGGGVGARTPGCRGHGARP
jgi:hypothetical protein